MVLFVWKALFMTDKIIFLLLLTDRTFVLFTFYIHMIVHMYLQK